MNEQYFKDVSKNIKKEPIKQILDPGVTSRRYEPISGTKKHNERIHKESRYVDEHKKLPFSFRKPLKPIGKTAYIMCNNCGNISVGTTATVGIICKSCGKFSTVTGVDYV